VLASDIDAASVKIAAQNARLNSVGDLVETILSAGFAAPQFSRHGPFDLVLANILANPLRRLATPMAAHLSQRGQLILSGLLHSQASAVIAAYGARGLVPRHLIRLDGWSSLLMCKTG
jgi:ribosomal protein L11 methyltransferase